MKVQELTEEQAELICDYMYDKHAYYDDKGFLACRISDVCKHCPLSIESDEGWNECFRYRMLEDLEKELEDYIKEQNKRP